jgi:hypothetical protein
MRSILIEQGFPLAGSPKLRRVSRGPGECSIVRFNNQCEPVQPEPSGEIFTRVHCEKYIYRAIGYRVMAKTTKKPFLKREITFLHFMLLATSKLLIGIAIGLILASSVWFVQPYWYLILIVGALILIPTLYVLMQDEKSEEDRLKKELRH